MIHQPYVARSDYLAITDQCPACHFIFVLVHLKDASIWDCGLILMFYPSRFSLEMISGYRSCNLNEQLTLSNSHWGKQFVATFSFSVHCNFCFEMNLREIHFLASKSLILMYQLLLAQLETSSNPTQTCYVNYHISFCLFMKHYSVC